MNSAPRCGHLFLAQLEIYCGENSRSNDLDLKQRELVANALAVTTAEGSELVGGRTRFDKSLRPKQRKRRSRPTLNSAQGGFFA